MTAAGEPSAAMRSSSPGPSTTSVSQTRVAGDNGVRGARELVALRAPTPRPCSNSSLKRSSTGRLLPVAARRRHLERRDRRPAGVVRVAARPRGVEPLHVAGLPAGGGDDPRDEGAGRRPRAGRARPRAARHRAGDRGAAEGARGDGAHRRARRAGERGGAGARRVGAAARIRAEESGRDRAGARGADGGRVPRCGRRGPARGGAGHRAEDRGEAAGGARARGAAPAAARDAAQPGAGAAGRDRARLWAARWRAIHGAGAT